ncbi:MAG: AAA family ATPase [Planctomycetota bacterium]
MTDALAPLSVEHLRWRCDPSRFAFEATHEVEPAHGIVGQDEAVEALQFGLAFHAPGQNVFVRGLTGTSRATLVHRMVVKARPCGPPSPDRVYVCNFLRSDRPRLLTLPRGQGQAFRRHLDRFIEFVQKELGPALNADVVRSQATALEQKFSAEVRALTEPFEADLDKAGYRLVMVQAGPATRQLIVPVVDGQPVGPEQVQALKASGKVDDATLERWDREIEGFGQRMQEIGERLQEIGGRRQEALQGFVRREARELLEQALRGVRSAFATVEVRAWLEAVVEDVTKRLGSLPEDAAFTERYRVNVVLAHEPDAPCPALLERNPSVQALIGTIDTTIDTDESTPYVPHMMVRAGSLLQADGGFLVIDSRDVLTARGAWKGLIRVLRAGQLEIEVAPGPSAAPNAFVKPDPIPIDVKVVLLGDAGTWHALDAIDPDFRDLFKVLADFDDVIDRDDQGLAWYASVIARIQREDELPPFTRDGVAALCEHGARIASQAEKLTARFSRLADLAREAAWLATNAGEARVNGDRVREAVRRTKRRAGLPSRRFQELIQRGVLRVETRGQVIGQGNGLAVIQTGQLTYGFPNRITATIAPGRRGTTNVEREAALSGRIHTKGFLLLEGLLRALLQPDHPLSFDASVAFEQSYGGVDGDSASGIELCCLISALTRLPLRQAYAMTGAIDQRGSVMAIGGVNEKIEGFYDSCAHEGLTGEQGVIIPRSNVGDLMLRHDVLEACAEGTFHVHAVDRIEQALELLLGRPAGTRGPDGMYPADSVLGIAAAEARRFYQASRRRPRP